MWILLVYMILRQPEIALFMCSHIAQYFLKYLTPQTEFISPKRKHLRCAAADIFKLF